MSNSKAAHPVTVFFKQLRKQSIDDTDYQRRRQFLADSLGINDKTFYHLSNPKQKVRLEPRKAFMLELLTEGAIPCECVSAGAKETLDLAEKVLDLRDEISFS